MRTQFNAISVGAHWTDSTTLIEGRLNFFTEKGDIKNNAVSYFYPWLEQYYPAPVVRYWRDEPSKIEQAFKLVNALMKEKIISKDMSVGQFVDLINKIAHDIL